MDWTLIIWFAVLTLAWFLLAPKGTPAPASTATLAIWTVSIVRMAASQRIILYTARSTWECPRRGG
jgi:hypothetical protein